MVLPTWIICVSGYWFILPSHLLTKTDFRRKLKIYMVYFLWLQIGHILREILSYLFANVPIGIQFLVPFIIAGCRELEKRGRSKLVTRMVGSHDEAAKALVSVFVNTTYSFFIAVRLVGAEFSTMVSTVGIEFVLHLKMAIQIIKEYKQVSNARSEIMNSESNTRITMLILAELVEGFTPIIYGACVVIAYIGPNASLFVNIGSSYWGEKIEDISSLLVVMSILFGFGLS